MIKRGVFYLLISLSVIFHACKDKEDAAEPQPTADTTEVAEDDLIIDDFTDDTLNVISDTSVVTDTSMVKQMMKIGYVNSEEILEKLPDMTRANTELEKFARTLDNQIKQIQQQMQDKYVKYMADTTVSDAILKNRQEELQGMQQRLMQLQYSSEQELAQKRQQLLKPIYDKVNRAIKVVAKANGYTHVLDANSLFYIDEAYNLTPQVKRQLGIK